MNKVHVIGIGFRPLERAAHDALMSSDVVLTNSRLLDVFRTYDEYPHVRERVLVHKTVYEMLDYIADNYKTRRLSVLAAGDPMFFGVGRLIVERLGPDPVEIFPDLSSLQVAFSRIKETSNNALLISLHGGPDPEKRRRLEYELADIPMLISRHEKIGILTDRETNPSVIADSIKSSIVNSQSSIVMFVCEKIGYPDERTTSGSPEEIAGMSFEHPNVVIIIARKSGTAEAAKQDASAVVFGLNESNIKHSKGLITKDEIRAVSIHKLRLEISSVLWDVGAGSGSVSIEAASICPDCRIYAIEKDEERAGMIEENIRDLNIRNIEVIKGSAPDVFNDLPAPDRVFIGGSSNRMSDILVRLGDLMPEGIVVVNAATIETLNEAMRGLEENDFRVEVTEVSVSRSKEIKGKRRMSALNPVFIVRGIKEGASQISKDEN